MACGMGGNPEPQDLILAIKLAKLSKFCHFLEMTVADLATQGFSASLRIFMIFGQHCHSYCKRVLWLETAVEFQGNVCLSRPPFQ